MTELIKLASSKACICFYFVEHAGDCMIVTDSAGNKRYVVGYSDFDGEVFWARCKDIES